jgi:hypothetical protein
MAEAAECSSFLIGLEIVRGYVIVPVAECKTASSGLGKSYLLGRSYS